MSWPVPAYDCAAAGPRRHDSGDPPPGWAAPAAGGSKVTPERRALSRDELRLVLVDKKAPRACTVRKRKARCCLSSGGEWATSSQASR